MSLSAVEETEEGEGGGEEELRKDEPMAAHEAGEGVEGTIDWMCS